MTTSKEAAVFDVVMHQKCVVQELECNSRRQRLLNAAAMRTTGRNAQSRAQPFSGARQLALDQVVQISPRLSRWHIFQQRLIRDVSVGRELLFDPNTLGQNVHLSARRSAHLVTYQRTVREPRRRAAARRTEHRVQTSTA